MSAEEETWVPHVSRFSKRGTPNPAAEAVEVLLVTARLKPCPSANPSPQTLLFFSQQVPDFPVGAVEAGAAGMVARGEEETGAVVDDVDGEDEPGVLGNDVGDEEVDLVEMIRNDAGVGAAVRIDVILAVEECGGGFHLDAPEAMSGFDDEVVALAVAVGLGHVETLGGGLVNEGQFGKFSSALGGEFALAGSLRPPGAGSARALASFTWHESPNEKGTSGWLVPGF